jgi:hypothetical protein
MSTLLKEEHDEALAKLREIDLCLLDVSRDSELESFLKAAAPTIDLNRMLLEEHPQDGRLGHTLLYTAIRECHCEAVALLLLHGADPFEPAVLRTKKRSLHSRTLSDSSNAVELCEMHLHANPLTGMFLLRLLDTRPVDHAVLGTSAQWRVHHLGRDVNAPLAHPQLSAAGALEHHVNALEWACGTLQVHCVQWLLSARNADPRAACSGFQVMWQNLHNNHESPEETTKALQIQVLLEEWLAPYARALHMGAHPRLGAHSPLRALGPQEMDMILHHLVRP